MCGIVGIKSSTEVSRELIDSLIHLQHRGQDAVGIITQDEKFHIKRSFGLVREVFSTFDRSRKILLRRKCCRGSTWEEDVDARQMPRVDHLQLEGYSSARNPVMRPRS